MNRYRNWRSLIPKHLSMTQKSTDTLSLVGELNMVLLLKS